VWLNKVMTVKAASIAEGPAQLTSVISGAVTISGAAINTGPNVANGTVSSGTLGNGTAQFAWTSGGQATGYWLTVGSTAGGTDLYSASQGFGLAATVPVPVDGRKLFVTLYTQIKGVWRTMHASFDALDARAVITSPSPGSKLSASAAFVWAAGTGVSEYWLTVGSAVNGQDIYSASQGVSTSRTVPVPVDGRNIFVTLYTKVNGVWMSRSFSYTTK
jgi:hypothetical protein